MYSHIKRFARAVLIRYRGHLNINTECRTTKTKSRIHIAAFEFIANKTRGLMIHLDYKTEMTGTSVKLLLYCIIACNKDV